MSVFIRFHLPPLLLALVIYLLSSLPGSDIPVVLFEGADKVIHAGMYTTLAWLLHRSLTKQTTAVSIRSNALLASVLLSLCYGWIDEWHQMSVPGRESSTGDFIADAFGALVYAAGYVVMRKLRDPGAPGQSNDIV